MLGERIRHRGELIRGLIDPLDEPAGTWSVELERPAWAPAPGQAAVLYDRDAVIGGGRIIATSAAAAA